MELTKIRVKMIVNHQTFLDTFRKLLEKSSVMSNKEMVSLACLFSFVINNRAFSLKKAQKVLKERFNRKFYAKSLSNYAYVQRRIAEQLIVEIAKVVSKRKRILLVLDDTVVFKTGRHIKGASKWYDHAKGRQINGFCLVNLAIVVGGEAIFVLPWLLRKEKKLNEKRENGRNNQDDKTLAAINLIKEVSDWLISSGFSKQKLSVVTDSWYSNKTMVDFLRKNKLNYRLDIRSNLSVQCPDHDAIESRGKKRRGRKRMKFVKYMPLKRYMGDFYEWKYFIEKSSNERIYYRTAIVTLKTTGRVKIYAFHNESMNRTKFIITPAKIEGSPTVQTVYTDYRHRWRIEEAHRDLKQQFGLGQCHVRQEWTVSGYIGLIFFGYSFWKFYQFVLNKIKGIQIKCPSWSNSFHNFVIRKKCLSLG